MNLAQTFSPSPWWLEREQILHKACQGVEIRLAHGQRPGRALRAVSWYRNGRPFKSDPKHRVRLAVATLHQHYRRWKLGGKVPEAFRFKYRPRLGGFNFSQPRRVKPEEDFQI
jgi:hypothetical protein